MTLSDQDLDLIERALGVIDSDYETIDESMAPARELRDRIRYDRTYVADAFESQSFYELMQSYRIAPLAPQSVVVAAFERVKTWARSVVSIGERR